MFCAGDLRKMLRKRTRSHQKDQNLMGNLTISDNALGSKLKNKSIFNVPRLFVGLVPNGLLDSDSISSPTSPLDIKVLSNLGNRVKTPKSSHHEWECSKVGLSIIDSLEDSSEKIFSSPVSKKNPIIGPGMRIKSPSCLNYTDSFEASKSLPKDFCKLPYTQNGSGTIDKGESNVLFEIGETRFAHEPFGKSRSCSLDSCNPFKALSGLTLSPKDMSSQAIFPAELNSSHEFLESLLPGEIENSEDYTCVISHGPNPKTTHIFGDCILETHPDDLRIRSKSDEVKEKEMSPMVISSQPLELEQYPSNDFLSFCNHCNKKLEEGKDIYIYRYVNISNILYISLVFLTHGSVLIRVASLAEEKKHFAVSLAVPWR